MSLKNATLDSVVLVSPDAVTPHEIGTDGHVDELVNAILEESCVRHPIISVAMGSRFLLLDGTHRLAALKSIGVQRVPLQVFERGNVTFDTWAKVVSHPRGSAPVLETPLEWRRGDDPDATVHLVASDGQVWHARHRPDTPAQRYQMVVRVLSSIQNAGVVRTSIPSLAKADGPGSFVLKFRAWTLDDVIESAQQGNRLPSGLTRVMAFGRILSLRVPLAMLRDQPFDSREWSEFIATAKRRARVYDEPTVLID